MYLNSYFDPDIHVIYIHKKYAEAGFLGERVDNYFAASWFLCCSSALTPASQSLAEDFCCWNFSFDPAPQRPKSVEVLLLLTNAT